VSQVHTLRRFLVHAAYQILIQRFGQEGREGRQQGSCRYQALVKRQVGGYFVSIFLALPETPPTATNIPVGQVFDKRPNCGGWLSGVKQVKALCHFSDGLLKLGKNPAV